MTELEDLDLPQIDASRAYVAVHGDTDKPALGPFYCQDGASYQSLKKYLAEVHPGYDLRSLHGDDDGHFRWELKQRP